MKTPAQYLQQASHNTEMAAFIRENKDSCLDWAATCLFYAAVHYVNAHLAHRGEPIPKQHRTQRLTGRSDIVEADPELRNIYVAYRYLDDESRNARYELKRTSNDEYDDNLVPQLDRIRQFVMNRVAA